MQIPKYYFAVDFLEVSEWFSVDRACKIGLIFQLFQKKVMM
jgi:hypothetical protein